MLKITYFNLYTLCNLANELGVYYITGYSTLCEQINEQRKQNSCLRELHCNGRNSNPINKYLCAGWQ